MQGYRTDSYDTLAFWYQAHPHQPFPPLPPLEDLLPIGHRKSFARGLWEIHQDEKARRLGAALEQARELFHRCPANPKAPDVLFKIGNLHKQLGQVPAARDCFQELLGKWPKSDAAPDAGDQLWLLAKPGRLLLTLVSQSGWTAHLDGEEIPLDPLLFKGSPPWAAEVHYRYGRDHVYRSDAPGVLPGEDRAENRVQWEGSPSSIMRMFTLRLEPGSGEHVLAVEARSSNTVPIRLESPEAPAFMACVLHVAGPDVVSDETWRVASQVAAGGAQTSTPDQAWESAAVHPNEEFGDAAWFWLHPAGFRKFPGYFGRVWGRTRPAADQLVYFQKTFLIP
jgi:hypothetical protein